jgi:serine protease
MLRCPAGLAIAIMVFSLSTLAATTSPAFAVPAARGFVPDYRTTVEHVVLHQVGVRFEAPTQARVRDGRLVSLSGADLSAVEAIVASIPGALLLPRFSKPEAELDRMRREGEARTRQDLPDLNLFARVDLPPLADEAAAKDRLRGLLAALNAAPGVAEAWALPVAYPATFTEPAPASPGRDTPDFSSLQGYLYDPPVGIWADSAWTFPGGLGQGVKVLTLEWGVLFTHEDLKPPFYLSNDQGPSDHGTAVTGMFGGQHNGFGINGIAGEVEIGAITLGDVASGILEAISVLAPGDLYNMSIQVGGPENWMPTEWWPDCFAAIQTGTALGVICMEAAGNGSVNLDDPLYGDYFDRRVRDSGAIMAGAASWQGLGAMSFSNYGRRLSLQGWGESVVTICCGDLQGGDPEVRYTAGFSGTSSATPMSAGAVASLQGQARALFGAPLTPALAEEILSVTGNPCTGNKPIGERPNLVAARERLLRGFGDVVVTVRDGDTQTPMPNMVVTIAETGRMHVTGSSGQIAMQLSAGPLTFHVSGDFYYTAADFPFTVEPGGNQETILDVYRTPLGSLAGSVRDERGAPLDSARVLITSTPIAPAWTGNDGSYASAGIPQNTGYLATASRVPGKGAAAITFDAEGGQTTPWDPILVDAQTFENGNGGYTATGEWEWGTPTFPNGPNRPIPPSGVKCWGTDLDNTYDALSTSVLTSPVIDLHGTTQLTLSFHHWMWIASDDGGQVQVYDAAQDEWVVVEPVGGYPDDNVIILYYGPGYNGQQTTWEPAIFRLDSYAGSDFRFRFYFRSNYQNSGVGWYIDDVALDWGQGPSAVDLSPAPASRLRILFAGPNPTGGASRIAFALGAAGPVRCEVYDLRGALARTLVPGRLSPGVHEMAWDGRDQAGRAVSSGIYLYRLVAGSATLEGKLVRIR